MDKRKKVGTVGFTCLIILMAVIVLSLFSDGYVKMEYKTFAKNILSLAIWGFPIMAFFANLSLFTRNHVRLFGIVATVLFFTNSIWINFFTEVTVEGYMLERYSLLGTLSLIGTGITSVYSGFFFKEE
jgi:hypothetical protein